MRASCPAEWLIPADCGTEGDESNGGFPDSEPGIQYFSSGRMGDFRAKAFFQGSTGCALMFGAIILAQIPVGRRRQASLNTEGN